MRKILLFVAILFGVCMSALGQKVGIGTTTPIARLEVKGEGNNSLTNTLVLKNSNNDTLLRMKNDGHMNLGYNGLTSGRTLNVGGNGINVFGPNDFLGGAIFPTDTSLVLWSDFGDNKHVILQPSWGRVGIGTNGPKVKFHVSNGSSGVVPNASAVATFEDNDDTSINLLAPNANSSALYFGNPSSAVHGGIVYNSPSPNGLAFRTNGNVNRAVINNVGDMGIGELTPDARFHVSDGVGGGLYFSLAEVIIEDNSATYLQFSNPFASESAILSGTDVTSIRSGIYFRPDSSVHIKAGGSSTKVMIDQDGNTGINTTTPLAKLEVNGNFILGANGNAVNEMIKTTVVSDIPIVAALDSEIDNFPVANCVPGSSVMISPANPLPDGLIIAYARVSGIGVVEVKFTNTTGAAINPASMNFFITVIR